jgi:hypothetical protein
VQNQLNEIYRSSFRFESLSPDLAERLSCPLLLAVGDAWAFSRRRILVVGQETLGWEFEAGQYYPWPYPPLESCRHFQTYEHGVEALVHAYRAFEFARHQPKHYRSPFWRAFRYLKEAAADTDVLWTNLFKCSVDDGSVVNNCDPEEIKQLLVFQRGVLAREIEILQPTAVLLFTGPRYDNSLSAEFPHLEFRLFGQHAVRQLAWVSAPDMCAPALRTYHPAYLARSEARWRWLEEIADAICP